MKGGAGMKKTETEKIRRGLEQLAFGKVNDAVELVFAEEIPPPENLKRMNLVNISSIKRVKGGGVEVQFFDRQKALERLYEYAREGQSAYAAEAVLAALTGEGGNGA
jgi:hypothetical protein